VVTVTERRCGMEDEITGCTLYTSMQRLRRHLIGGSVVDRPPPTHHRRRETLLLVEVCTSGCGEDGCIGSGQSAIRHSLLTTLSLIPLICLLMIVLRGP